jgi:uncharacterized protein
MLDRKDIEFPETYGVILRGWPFVPRGRGPQASRDLHGARLRGVKEHGLERFVGGCPEAGFVVLAHDHRNFGLDEG